MKPINEFSHLDIGSQRSVSSLICKTLQELFRNSRNNHLARLFTSTCGHETRVAKINTQEAPVRYIAATAVPELQHNNPHRTHSRSSIHAIISQIYVFNTALRTSEVAIVDGATPSSDDTQGHSTRHMDKTYDDRSVPTLKMFI